jgi:hypothetical protein
MQQPDLGEFPFYDPIGSIGGGVHYDDLVGDLGILLKKGLERRANMF